MICILIVSPRTSIEGFINARETREENQKGSKLALVKKFKDSLY